MFSPTMRTLATVKWGVKDVLSVRQFDRDKLAHVFRTAECMREIVKERGGEDLLHGKILANVFFEPSTRTSCSFQAAMLRLGGTVIPVTATGSSVEKGETLADTVRCLESYCDVMVLRHQGEGSVAHAAKYTRKPMINAGDGVGEHPTQALLDAFTMLQEMPDHRLDGKTIVAVGDLKHSRTIHSLVRLLALYSDINLHLVAPASLSMPSAIVREISSSITITEHLVPESCLLDSTLEGLLPVCDVMYVTRIQKERFDSHPAYESVRDAYRITTETMALAKSTMVLMHPLPRASEIAPEVDSDPRAAYFRQMENGMYVRMAILALVLEAV